MSGQIPRPSWRDRAQAQFEKRLQDEWWDREAVKDWLTVTIFKAVCYPAILILIVAVVMLLLNLRRH